ncbi:hypothetical protein ALC60_07974 [Trachymyrmex zeteki]|uniref:Ras-associating domain-containing protein n=1 Tax=Mycetomoellerius zeteki TaxID=64791 RepID=A0A151WYN3_9HYME|nr:PREDICTED: uncharacterized protein LOC108724789 [Trachymyrmex zeteki]KYQ52896.1 hypothetical protein ALC60_07974 [Trachymyrmex zeteki]
MLKHVSITPWRGRADSVSLSSSGGASSCGSGSPTPGHTPPPSRASSCASLAPLTALSSFSPADTAPQQTTIKVYANCLRPDIEYKTLSITYETTCREVVQNLLNKYRMRHRDPRLFYLTMEVTVRRANVRTILPLDEDARPAVLQSCHPRGDSKFSLQTHRGGLVKIYDSALMSGSKYKSLLVSEQTTVDELIQMLLSCYSSKEPVEQFSLYEVCEGEEYQRKLHPDDSPLKVTQRWTSVDRHLRIRRNPDYNQHRRRSMWASDSSITMAMSRLDLQDSLPIHYNTRIENNNHLSLHHLARKTSVTANNNNNNVIHRDQHHSSSLGSISQTSRIVVSHGTDLPQVQLPRLQQFPQSVPSTPLSTKHVTASSYADYENYLFI